jgi:hypothetical protein
LIERYFAAFEPVLSGRAFSLGDMPEKPAGGNIEFAVLSGKVARKMRIWKIY